MKNFNYLLLVILSFGLFSCSNHYKKQLLKKSDNLLPILIKGVDIFNGKDSILIIQQDVVLEDGIIKSISSDFVLKNNKSYKIINGEGKTLMPGLIDAHVHLSGSGSVPWENVSANEEYNLAAYLHTGITTVYDLGGLASGLEKLSKKVEKGKVLGPSIYHGHIPITVKNGHPIPLTKEMLSWPLKSFVNSISPTIDDIDDAEKVIDKYIKKDVDYIKIIYDQIPPGSPEMTYDQLSALINEAHKKGYKVFVHIGSPQNAVDAVNAGADILAHGIWRGKLTPEQADVIAKAKVPVIYTLAAFQNVDMINEGKYYPNDYDTTIVPEKILDPVMGKSGLDVKSQEVMGAFFEDVSKNSMFWLNNFKLLQERNVPIIMGTDSSLPGTYAGSTYFQEMDALKAYGASNFEILTGATYLASRLFLDSPDFGTIKEGEKANVLLINGNPMENLELVRTPERIFLNGELILKID